MEKIKGRLGCAVGMVKPRIGSVQTALVDGEPTVVTITSLISEEKTGVLTVGENPKDAEVDNNRLGALVFHPLKGKEVMVLSRALAYKAVNCLKDVCVATIEDGEMVDIEAYDSKEGKPGKEKVVIPESETLSKAMVYETLEHAEECAIGAARSLMEKVNVCTTFTTIRQALGLPEDDTFDRSFNLYKNATDEEKEQFTKDSEVMKKMLGIDERPKGGLSLGSLLGGLNIGGEGKGPLGLNLDDIKDLLRKLKGESDDDSTSSKD